MNPFAALACPLVNRPGDAIKERRERPQQRRELPEPIVLPRILNPWDLSPMQCEVLRRVVQGDRSKDIAAAMGRSSKTVDEHFFAIREKMGARSILVAALMWDRHFRQDA